MRSTNSKFKTQQQDIQPSQFPCQPIQQTTITRNYNHLTSIPIPSSSKIFHLHLAHNQISSLLNIDLYPNLQSFNISHNHLNKLQQFNVIVNKDKLLRLSVRCNKLEDYGYQDKLVFMFKNLQELDHIKLNNRVKIDENIEYIKSNYVQSFYIIERLKTMMTSFVNQTKVNQTITQIKSQNLDKTKNTTLNPNFHKKGLLKLLYQNINQKSIYELTNIIRKCFNIQNMQHLNLSDIMVKIIKIILISDFKCTCRPFNLRKALLDNYGQILNSMIQTFATKFNNQLPKYLQRKMQSNFKSIKTDQKHNKMQRLIQFSKLQPQNIKIMNTLDYKKYFQKQSTSFYNEDNIKANRLDSKEIRLTTKPEQYFINKAQEQKQKLDNDNSPDQFLFRFPVFAYTPDYLLVMLTILKNKIQQIIQFHNTIVIYQTNKSRHKTKKQHVPKTNNLVNKKPIQKHSKSRSYSHENENKERKSNSTKARTTLYHNQNINYINQISFQKTLPESTKGDQTKSNTIKISHPKKQKLSEIPILTEPITAQKLYEITLKFKTFGALILNIKQSQMTSKF